MTSAEYGRGGLGASLSRMPVSMPGSVVSEINVRYRGTESCAATMPTASVRTVRTLADLDRNISPRAKGWQAGNLMLLQVRKRIDCVHRWIERCLDACALWRNGFPQVDLVWSFKVGSIGGAQHLYPRAVGIRRVGLGHDGDLAGSQTDEVACRIDSDKLSESPDQVLIELCSV